MRNSRGFTIVELLIVIVVIGILAAIVIVAYNGVQQRAAMAKRTSDMALLLKGIHAARINENKSIGEITGFSYLSGRCAAATYNASLTEPRDLPKTHVCWTMYSNYLDMISAKSGMSLGSLKAGDSRGNPYVWDENEGEGGNRCLTDTNLLYFTGSGVVTAPGPAIDKYYPIC